MSKYTLLLLAIIIWSIHIQALTQLNPYGRDLKILLQEPPLKYDAIRNTDHVKEQWLEQKLDHTMGSECNQTWLMRYISNDEYYQPGGPIFIYAGGEWEISKGYLLTGHIHDMARQHNAMFYYTEHRYYGQSWPVSNTSVENLKYLSVQQALGDLAHFIQHQKATVSGLNKAKVILTGGSYGGSMVAWFNQLHPEMEVSASWASSAPMRAQMDYYEYMELVGSAIQRKGGSACYNRIEKGMNGLVELLETNETAEILLDRLKVCPDYDPTNTMHMAAFFNGIGNHFAGIVQGRGSAGIQKLCSSLLSKDQNYVEAFIEYVKKIFWGTVTPAPRQCIKVSYDGMKQLFTDINDKNSNSRQWFYQTCNEFGFYLTTATSTNQHPFARQVPLGYFQQMCGDILGQAYTSVQIAHGVDQTNAIFANGSYENVFFTHGQLDPWRAVGKQSGRNVIVIPDYSHCADFGSIDFRDSVEMNVAKLRVAAFLYRSLRAP